MGTSLTIIVSFAPLTDHPHAYGDKLSCQSTGCQVLGSSPRVWGQVLVYIMVDVLCRIIPTRMGTRIEKRGIITHTEDHPHAYGDKFISLLSIARHSGSSPRVWGQVLDTPYDTGLNRIIPTRMGTSILSVSAYIKPRDHPHAYGDKPPTAVYNNKRQGSSPRVWGQELVQRLNL